MASLPMVFLLKNALSDNATLYQTMQHLAGEGWLGLEKLHQLTKKGLYRLKVSLNEKIIIFALGIINMFFSEFNKMLKVSLTNRGWNDYVGYWNWIKVFTLKQTKPGFFNSSLKAVSLHFFGGRLEQGKATSSPWDSSSTSTPPLGTPSARTLAKTDPDQPIRISQPSEQNKCFFKTFNVCPPTQRPGPRCK